MSGDSLSQTALQDGFSTGLWSPMGSREELGHPGRDSNPRELAVMGRGIEKIWDLAGWGVAGGGLCVQVAQVTASLPPSWSDKSRCCPGTEHAPL